MSDPRADLVLLLAETHDDPEAFFDLVLKVKPRRWQTKLLREIGERLARGEKHLRIHARTCHGSGKTFAAAGIGIWYVSTRPGCRGVTLATAWTSVSDLLWVEVAAQFKHSLLAACGMGRLLDTSLTFGDGWDIVGLSSDDSANLEGRHGNSAIRITDEAKSVRPAILESTEGLLDAGETLDMMISVPSIPSGPFYDREMRGGADLIRAVVTVDDLVAEGIDGKAAWRERRAEEWGLNSPEFRSRAMAEYVSDAEGALFPFSWIARAESAAFTVNLTPVCGVDIAGSVAGDASALAVLAGPDEEQRFRVHAVESWKERDTSVTRGKALGLARMAGAEVIAVDYVGIGQGVGDAMRGEKGITIAAFRASDKAEEPDRFQNRKAEVAWFLRGLLEAGRMRLPRHDNLRRELLGMRYVYTIAGKVKVLDPSDSPDLVDAILIALSTATGSPPLSMAQISFGSSDTAGWSDGGGWGSPSTGRRERE